MKKKILFGFLSLLAFGTGVLIQKFSHSDVKISDITLENIDALANGEHDRCDVSDCKSVKSGTCYYYVISGGNISETGEKRPYAYDPHGLM